MGECSTNLHKYIIVTSLRTDYILMTLTQEGQSLVSRISFEKEDGFSLNLHRNIIVTSIRDDYILMTLISFSRS